MFLLDSDTQFGQRAPVPLDLTPPHLFKWQAQPGQPGTAEAQGGQAVWRAHELGTVPFQTLASWRWCCVLDSSLVLRREDYVKRHKIPLFCLEKGPSLLSVLGALAEWVEL